MKLPSVSAFLLVATAEVWTTNAFSSSAGVHQLLPAQRPAFRLSASFTADAIQAMYNTDKSEENSISGEESERQLSKSATGSSACPDPVKYTESILDPAAANIPLSKDTLEYIPSILQHWAKSCSKEGAETAEKLIKRLDAADSGFELNCRHYTMLVDAWARSDSDDGAKNAEGVLTKMISMGASNPSLAPTRVTYNTVMHAFLKKGDTKRASVLLQEMEDSSGAAPIRKDYHLLLGAYAQRGDARKAEHLLKRMVERCRQFGDRCLFTPDVQSYNFLLHAWASSEESGRAARAEQILSALEKEVSDGTVQFELNPSTYTLAMLAVIRSKESNTTERARAIFERALNKGFQDDKYLYATMLDAYAMSNAPSGSAEKAVQILKELEASPHMNSVIDEWHYNIVLKALKTSDLQDAENIAESLLSSMEQKDLADAISYTTSIAIFAQKGTASNARRADDLLQRMKANGVAPNEHTLNTLINAWIKCGDIQRAEQILLDMEEAYSRGEGIAPSVVSYTTIMNGWAKSSDPDALDKTAEMFRRLISMYRSGNEKARPNSFSFVTMIDAFVRSATREGSAERAEELIYQMYQYYKAGNKDLKPNVQMVTSVINCWQRSGHREAGTRAEGLLEWLVERYDEEKDPELRPNEYTFNSVITAWGKSRQFGKALRARNVLNRMAELHKAGIIESLPNAYCYSGVLNACAFVVESDDIERRDALETAIATYKEIIDSDDVERNKVIFNTAIVAFRNLLPRSEKRTAVLTAVFERCADEGHVDDTVVQRLESALTPSELRAIFGNKIVSDDGKVDTSRMIADWSRKVKSKSKTSSEKGARTPSRRRR